MALHDDYQTLLWRGMPEHERVYWYRFGEKWILRFVSSDQIIHTDDARDLITMHALEWVLGLVRASKLCVARTPYVLNFIDAPGAERAAGKDIIEAILAATEHLEPK